MRLYLLRHAKSSWGDPSLADEERPLNARGKRAAQALREHFAQIGLQVGLVLVSPARRTRDTWNAVAAGVGGEPEIRFEPDVYEATFHDLAQLVREATADRDPGPVMIVGHNPGTEELLAYLTGEPIRPVPTGGFVTLDVETVTAGGATLVDVVHPREL